MSQCCRKRFLSSSAYSQHHCSHSMTTVQGWAQPSAVELRSSRGFSSLFVHCGLLQTESIFARLLLNMEAFELDSLAALCSCSWKPLSSMRGLSALSQMLAAERRSNDFSNAFSVGLLSHKTHIYIVVVRLHFLYPAVYSAPWWLLRCHYFQLHKWFIWFCKSAVVGWMWMLTAVPESNPGPSFLWVLLLGYLPGCTKVEIAEESTLC